MIVIAPNALIQRIPAAVEASTGHSSVGFDPTEIGKFIMRVAKSIMGAIAALGLFYTPANAANIVETAANTGKFQTLLAAAQAAGLASTLAEKGPLTVFAPTDEAFEKLPDGTVATLLRPENKDKLVAILTYHVVGRSLTSNMLPHETIAVRPLNGQANTLKVEKSAAGVTVNGANVISADISADNGVIHVIDQVLLPN